MLDDSDTPITPSQHVQGASTSQNQQMVVVMQLEEEVVVHLQDLQVAVLLLLLLEVLLPPSLLYPLQIMEECMEIREREQDMDQVFMMSLMKMLVWQV